jgi:hypothetical protein
VAGSFISKIAIPSSLSCGSQRIDHVQAPCSWSADLSIGNDCAFDCTGSNDAFGFNIGGPCLSPSCFMNKVKILGLLGLLFEIVHLFKFLPCRAAEET